MDPSQMPDATIRIVTSDGKKITMNRYLLASYSKVFLRIIESKEIDGKTRIRIKENYEYFMQFVRFMNEDNLVFQDFHHAFEMFKISKKYIIKRLEKLSRRIILTIGKDFSTKIYEYAAKISDKELQLYCWKLFREFSDDHIKGEEFIFSGKRTISRFVSCPIYNNLSELGLFIGLYRWAKMKVIIDDGNLPNVLSIRRLMEPYLPHIRFLSMQPNELQEVFNKNILNESEVKAIKDYLNNSDAVIPAETICKTFIKRSPSNYRDLFDYINNFEWNLSEEKLLTENQDFYCELLVKEECFLTKLLLPIYHEYSGLIPVTISLYRISNDSKTPLMNLDECCDGYGKISIYQHTVIFEKNCHYIMKIRFSYNTFIKDFKTYILRGAQSYLYKNNENQIFCFSELFF